MSNDAQTNWSLPASRDAQLARGRALREEIPLAALGEIGSLARGARDPLEILRRQNATRVAALVPLRTERMSQSPFAFYRGTAALMAADFARAPHTGVSVPSCGDAHIANFGFYGSPQRTLMFDLNDFDEAAWAPWEWDLKRLVASIVIAGEASARDEAVIGEAVLGAVRSYARAIRSASAKSPRDRYYTHFDAEAGFANMSPASQKVLSRATKHARRRTGERAARKLTITGHNGRMRFIEQPPTMQAVEPEIRHEIRQLIRRYLQTAMPDIRLLFQHYELSDVVRRVVGVGSVGTRCALTLFQDGDGNALILQTKEARPSVLEEFGEIEQPRELAEHVVAHGHGGRVVAMQRILQAVSDPFLGYFRMTLESAGDVDLYVRQFHDMKGGIEAETLEDGPFDTYARACAVTLARAHAQSPAAGLISGYVGGGRRLGEVLLAWGYAYSAISRGDYEAFRAAA